MLDTTSSRANRASLFAALSVTLAACASATTVDPCVVECPGIDDACPTRTADEPLPTYEQTRAEFRGTREDCPGNVVVGTCSEQGAVFVLLHGVFASRVRYYDVRTAAFLAAEASSDISAGPTCWPRPFTCREAVVGEVLCGHLHVGDRLTWLEH